MKPCFTGSYHIIAPDQGGHGKAGGCKSADEEACMDQIKAFMGSVRR